MKRTIIALSMGTALVLTGCNTSGSGGGTNRPGDGFNTEVEDCDAEDRANREAECGFKKPTKKPATKPKSGTKPKTRTGTTTRRK